MANLEELQQIVVNNVVDIVEDDLLTPRTVLHPFRQDPFNLSDRQFLKIYRLHKEGARELINILEPHLAAPTRISAIDKATKVLTAVRFFGSGSYQTDIGLNIYSAVSQHSVSNCLKEVTDALNLPHIFNQYIHFPRNNYELAVKRGEFPGRTHDAHIWRQSNVKRLLEHLHDGGNGDTSFFLIGDSGYPLRTYLQIPFVNPVPNSPEALYNLSFKSARSTIERCNGVLKARFRCLLKHRVLHYNPTKASKIINACAVLHNFCIANNIDLPPPPPPPDEELDVDFGMFQIDPLVDRLGRRNPDLLRGERMRNQLVLNYNRL